MVLDIKMNSKKSMELLYVLVLFFGQNKLNIYSMYINNQAENSAKKAFTY